MHVAILTTILFSQQITKVLIRPHSCAGWSAHATKSFFVGGCVWSLFCNALLTVHLSLQLSPKGRVR